MAKIQDTYLSVEQQHLAQFKEGNLKSFNWLYHQYHKRVFSFSLTFVNDRFTAEEVTADVFVKLWHIREKIDVSFPIQSLLFKMTKDYVWNYLKKQAREKEYAHDYLKEQSAVERPTIEDELMLQDYLHITEQAAENLPHKRRLVFQLHSKMGLNNKEIAKRLNISEVTVRIHLMKANQYLRQYLQSHPEITISGFGLVLLKIILRSM